MSFAARHDLQAGDRAGALDRYGDAMLSEREHPVGVTAESDAHVRSGDAGAIARHQLEVPVLREFDAGGHRAVRFAEKAVEPAQMDAGRRRARQEGQAKASRARSKALFELVIEDVGDLVEE